MPQGLLPQDVVVLAKLVSYGGARPPIAQVSGDLGLSPSQVHASLKRLERSRLVDAQTGRPLSKAVEEFLIHGVKYAFPVQRGEATRGMPTAYAAPPLRDQFADSGDLPPVWPDPDGELRGATLEPLHKAAPNASRKDPVLHELLALIDALRDGRVRERQSAEKELSARLRRLLRG
jgi:DNA-binding Lrp family transcriptional regulator